MSFSEALTTSISKIVDSYSSKDIFVIDSVHLDIKVFDSLEKLTRYVLDTYYAQEKIYNVIIYSTEKSNKFDLDICYLSGYRSRLSVHKQYINITSPSEETKSNQIILEVKK